MGRRMLPRLYVNIGPANRENPTKTPPAHDTGIQFSLVQAARGDFRWSSDERDSTYLRSIAPCLRRRCLARTVVREILADVTADQAVARPSPRIHNIWELVA